MGFFTAVRKCGRDWVTFSGRAPRSEYWWFYLAYVMTLVASVMIILMFVNMFGTSGGLMASLIIFAPIAIFVQVAQISVTVRRLHDCRLSGWWVGLAYLLSVMTGFIDEASYHPDTVLWFTVGSGAVSFILFIITLLPGTEGPNKYGDDPLHGFSVEVFE